MVVQRKTRLRRSYAPTPRRQPANTLAALGWEGPFRACRLLSAVLAVGVLFIASCVEPLSPREPLGQLEQAYKHALPPGPPYAFYLTTFGAGSDAQNTSCGKWVDGSWWYSTGVYHWGCGAKLKVEANGQCGVVEVTDNGPAEWVEQKAATGCGGAGGVKDGYILDVSPKLAQHLFGVLGSGWSDCRVVLATPVDASTPTGPCQSTGPVCGNGTIESGETCDPPSTCPSSCDDGNACTADSLIGSGLACTASCQHTAITRCQGGDGCCPAGCSFASDSDCAAPPPDLGTPPPDLGTTRDLAIPAQDRGPMRDTGPSPTLDRGASRVDGFATRQDQGTGTLPGSGALEGGCRLSGEASEIPSLDGTLRVLLALFGLLALRRRIRARGV